MPCQIVVAETASVVARKMPNNAKTPKTPRDLYARKEDKRSADSCLSMIFMAGLLAVVFLAGTLFGW